jgi:hypothetical protein
MFGDTMFKFIQHWLNTLMVLVGTSSRREVVAGQYRILMDELTTANTLSDLMSIKKNIRAFDVAVKKMGSPHWAANYTVYLEARWNRQYRLWKLRD